MYTVNVIWLLVEDMDDFARLSLPSCILNLLFCCFMFCYVNIVNK